MSFDSFENVQPVSGFDEEADLPPKLAALAEQLNDDARRLERRYPARQGHQLRNLQAAIARPLHGGLTSCGEEARAACQPATRSEMAADQGAKSRALRRWFIAASAVAATVAMVLTAWQVAFVDELERRASPAAPVAMPAAADQVAQAGDRPDGIAPSAAEFRPTDNILRGLSAAEQEAVLDLFEDGAEPSASLSI